MQLKTDSSSMIKKAIVAPFGISGFGVGMGLVGDALGSTAMVDAGQTATGFIAPAVTLSMGGVLIKQLKDIQTEVNNGKEKESKENNQKEKVRFFI